METVLGEYAASVHTLRNRQSDGQTQIDANFGELDRLVTAREGLGWWVS